MPGLGRAARAVLPAATREWVRTQVLRSELDGTWPFATSPARRLSRRLLRGSWKVQVVPTQVFSIGIYTGQSVTSLEPWAGRDNPVLTRADVSDVPAVFVADPFMVRDEDQWCMFFEVYNAWCGRGEIGLATSADGLTWRYRQIVLREPFHLSYPYVFRWQDTYYMVPEACESGAVRLYRAMDFPVRWTFEQTLIQGADLVDPCPFRVGDTWWMFVGGGDSPIRSEKLRLFGAEDLRGPWVEHPGSPIHANDPVVARPAGRVSVSDGRIVRYAQQCAPEYGLRVRAFEVAELTRSTYREEPAKEDVVLDGSGSGWNAGGMHHIDVHPLDEGAWIACVDGWRWEDVAV
jgi:hypothetical protein